MCTYLICLAGLLAALVFVEPVSGKEMEKRMAVAPPCLFIRNAANQTQLEAEARARLIQPESNPAKIDLAPVGNANLGGDRKLFELALANWIYFEDLAFEQRAILHALLGRCDVAADRLSLAASIFGQFNVSERGTFVGITHGLMHTRLKDKRTGEDLGDALGLIQELIHIQGENSALPSDRQFQLTVRLTPDALQKLERAAHFERGENHFFHKDYPISFRQFRQLGRRGQEAGLHLCLTRDGHFAQIHIDYRFGFFHLAPSNSDVRAEGNHQRHTDRWPEFTLAERAIRVRRVVLLRENSDLRLNSLVGE